MASAGRIMDTSIPGMMAYQRRKKEDNKDNYKKHVWVLKG